MWGDREVVTSAEGIARITEAILADEPGAEAGIARALASGEGMMVRTLEQAWLPDVAVVWVMIGDGPDAFARYLAVAPGDGARLVVRVLTGRPEVFATLGAAPAVSEDAVLELGLFALEVTRRLDVGTQLLTRDERPEDPRHALALDVLSAAPESQFECVERLVRLREAEGEVPLSRARQVVWAVTQRSEQDSASDPVLAELGEDLASIGWLRRLPTAALTADERLLFVRAHERLPPCGPGRLVHRIDALGPAPDLLARRVVGDVGGVGTEGSGFVDARILDGLSPGLYVSLAAGAFGAVADGLLVPPSLEDAFVFEIDPSGGRRTVQRFVAGEWRSAEDTEPDDADWVDRDFAVSWIGAGRGDLPRARKAVEGGVVEALVGQGETVSMLRIRIGPGVCSFSWLRIL